MAVTGIAGPAGATPGKPVGLVCFGWGLALPGGDAPLIEVASCRFDGDRRVDPAAGGLACAGRGAEVDSRVDWPSGPRLAEPKD